MKTKEKMQVLPNQLDQTKNTVIVHEQNSAEPLADDIIEVKDLVKVINSRFPKKRIKKVILNGISFQIKRGEHTAILGANGAGKTTLVEILCGITDLTSGKIIYNLRSPNYKSHLGIQFQQTNYPSGLSVKDIVIFNAKLYGLKTKSTKFKNFFKIFEIDKIYKKNISSLSGGEAQRVNIMLSLLHEPEVLFLDELSTGLDITTRTKIKQFIKDYADQHGITIVIVSHDIEEINYIARHIIFLENGKKVIDNDKSQLVAQYGTLANFLNQKILDH